MGGFTKVLGVLLAICIALPAIALPEPTDGSTAAVQDAPPPEPSSFIFVPQISLVSPTQWKMAWGNYEFPYTKKLEGLTVIHVGIATPLLTAGAFQMLALVRAGYSYKHSAFEIQERGGTSHETSLSLHFVPMLAGTKLTYDLSGMGMIKPSLTLGAGAHFVYQSSDEPGVSHDFLIPFVLVSPGITFLDSASSGDWFGGLTFAPSFFLDVASRHRLRGWSFDLSVNVNL